MRTQGTKFFVDVLKYKKQKHTGILNLTHLYVVKVASGEAIGSSLHLCICIYLIIHEEFK